MNAVIEGANVIIRAMDVDPVVPVATGKMSLTQWLASGDTGESSQYLAACLSRSFDRPYAYYAYPYDSKDFGRCYRLLTCVSELRDELPRMRSAGSEWNILVSVWPALERLYEAKKFAELNQELASIRAIPKPVVGSKFQEPA